MIRERNEMAIFLSGFFDIDVNRQNAKISILSCFHLLKIDWPIGLFPG